MKIAIYQKAFDSIFALPRNEQKAFLGMINKAREDSTMASLHLEPISTFRDKQLRTMRITQKYRAILRAPDTGDTYTLLHVGNHDEAMAWAENKLFEWNPRTESYQVFTAAEGLPETTEDVTSPDEELSQAAGAFGEYSDEQLLDLGVPAKLLSAVRGVSDATDLERLYDHLPIEALESLSMLLDGTDYHLLVQTIEDGKTGDVDDDAQRASGNNLRSFLPLDSDELIDQMLAGELAKWKVFLHPTQRKLVTTHTKGPTKVTGGAGTGKTVAALHRAKWLQDQGEPGAGQNIVFTTFTRTLAQNLSHDALQLGIRKDRVRIVHFDELFTELARDQGLVTSHQRLVGINGARSSIELFNELLDGGLGVEYDAAFLASEYTEVKEFHDLQDRRAYYDVSRRGRGVGLTRKGRIAVWKAFEAYDALKAERNLVDRYQLINALTRHLNEQEVRPYSHLVVDEVQDFTNVELRLLRALVPEGANDMFLVGDPLQRIYRGQVVFSQAGINVLGRRSKRLRLNYRTTDAIRRRAVAVLQGAEFTDFDEGQESTTGYRSLRPGSPPRYELFKQSSEEADFIVQAIQERLAAHPDELSPSDFVIATRTSSAVHDFRIPLERAGLAYNDLTDRKLRGTQLGEGVRLSTFHNLKGMEFRTVFLADVSQSTWPLRPSGFNSWDAERQAAHLVRERSLLYVAMTRAVQEVVLTGRGSGVGELATLD